MSRQVAAVRDPQAQMSQIQRQIQQDWANREYIEVITCSIKKISDFLNSFGENVEIFLLKRILVVGDNRCIVFISLYEVSC